MVLEAPQQVKYTGVVLTPTLPERCCILHLISKNTTLGCGPGRNLKWCLKAGVSLAAQNRVVVSGFRVIVTFADQKAHPVRALQSVENFNVF